MAHLIGKDAVVAEIKRIIKEIPRGETDKRLKAVYGNEAFVLMNLLSFINDLEVKEVDLEHEVESYWKQCDMTWCKDAYSMTHIRSMLSDIAKHFFELGLSVNIKAQKEE